MTRRTSLLAYRVLITSAAALLTAVVVDAAERATGHAEIPAVFSLGGMIR